MAQEYLKTFDKLPRRNRHSCEGRNPEVRCRVARRRLAHQHPLTRHVDVLPLQGQSLADAEARVGQSRNRTRKRSFLASASAMICCTRSMLNVSRGRCALGARRGVLATGLSGMRSLRHASLKAPLNIWCSLPMLLLDSCLSLRFRNSRIRSHPPIPWGRHAPAGRRPSFHRGGRRRQRRQVPRPRRRQRGACCRRRRSPARWWPA